MLPSDTSIYRVLQLSRPSFTTGYGVFRQIINVSRLNNARLHVSGALVFDGEQFCHLLEGRPEVIQPLVATIRADPRHHPQAVLYEGAAAGPRLLTVWKSGYCDEEALRVFQGDNGLEGQAALDTFIELLQRCDMAG